MYSLDFSRKVTRMSLNGVERFVSSLTFRLNPRVQMASSPVNYGSVSAAVLPSSEDRSPSPPLSRAPRRSSVFFRDQPAEEGYFDIQTYDETEDLIRTSYKSLIINHALVPAFSLLFIILFSIVPALWQAPRDSNGNPIRNSPHPTDLLAGLAGWIVSYSFRTPSFILSTCFTRYTNLSTATLSHTIAVLVSEAIRLLLIPLLGISLTYHASHPTWIPYPNPEDPAFQRIWWFALGWAIGVEVYATVQMYGRLILYKDFLEEDQSDEERGAQGSMVDDLATPSDGRRYVSSILKATSPLERGPGQIPSTSFGASGNQLFSGQLGNDSTAKYLEHETTQLVAMRTRAELEEVYGCPPPNIPVFISCLQRLDSLLLNMGLTLIISARYLNALVNHPFYPPAVNEPFSASSTPAQFPPSPDIPASLLATLPTFILIVVIHSCLSLMWAEGLPVIGVHTASYAALLLALGIFFVGLAMWGALA